MKHIIKNNINYEDLQKLTILLEDEIMCIGQMEMSL